MTARYIGDVASLEPPTPSGDEHPSRGHAVRMVLTPLAVLLAGVASILWWNLVAGVLACVVGVATAALEVGIAVAYKKAVLAPHANVFALIARLKDPAGAHRSVAVGPSCRDAEDVIDAAVGFGLTRAAAQGSFFAAMLDEGQRERLRENVLAERALTYEWLRQSPEWQPVSLEAFDGAVLEAHLLRCAPESGKWVVLCHGYAGTWDSMLQYARHWAQAGFNLLVPSMRAHGGSGGALIGMGFPDRRDVVSWARLIVDELAGDVPARAVVLMGHSMGACAVNLANAERDLPDEVRAVVSDCGFDTVWNANASFLDSLGVPIHPSLDLVRMLLRVSRGGYDIGEGDVVEALRHARVPTMFVHGAADATVPAFMLRRLADAAGPGCEAMLVDGAGHCQSSLADPNMYWDGVLDFVQRHVG